MRCEWQNGAMWWSFALGAVVLMTFVVQLAMRQPKGFVHRTVNVTAIGALVLSLGMVVMHFLPVGG